MSTAFRRLACIALLAGCTQSSASPVALPEGRSDAGVARSWVAPEGRRQNLLYVSGNSGYVYIYTFPAGKLVGTLAGFQEVAGVCSDAAGNVFVANSAGLDVIEYAHGGSSPIATLADGENYSFSCSVDPRNGDLAVSNIFSLSGGGSIAIYHHARGVPTMYQDPQSLENFFIGYGPRLQLFFDAQGSGVEFWRFHRGRFSAIDVKGVTMNSPEGIQYARGSLTISAPDGSQNAFIYRLTTSGTITGATHLLDGGDCLAYDIWKTYVICASSNGNVPVFAYPAGGPPIETIGPSSGPFAVVISEAPKR